MKKYRKYKNKIKNIFYLILIFVLLLLNFLDFKNFNWHKFFSEIKISDVIINEDLNNNYNLNVHFLDVGKADCIFINYKNNNISKNILIDAADKEPFGTVTEYLKKQNVKNLDLIIISHPHRDHIGQMPEVIREFKIGKFFEPEIPEDIMPTTITYQNMLEELYKKRVPCESVKHGKKFYLEDLYFEIFGPVSHNENLNNNSIVLKLTYKNISFLFTGDAERSEESEILNKNYNIKSDILKVAHHGSKTSSSKKFLEKIMPKYCIISVGHDKSNLPKPETLKRLENICENIYRTDIHGNIIVSTDGENIKILTQK